MNPLMNMQGIQSQGGQPFSMQALSNQQQQNPIFMMPQQGGFGMGMQGSPGPWSTNGNGISPQQAGLFNGAASGSGSEGAVDLGSRLGPQYQGSLNCQALVLMRVEGSGEVEEEEGEVVQWDEEASEDRLRSDIAPTQL